MKGEYMSEKRRDNKGRILKTGESQKKNGQYIYQYTNSFGERKVIYSWKLVTTDKVPAGKREDVSLREKIKEIERKLEQELIITGQNMTVLQLVQKYIGQKTGVKDNTRNNYNFVINIIKKEPFGQLKINEVKKSDAKAWLIKLQQVDGRGYSTIHSVRGVVRPAFQMAVDDDILLKNPFEFQLATVVVNDSVTRDAITRKQQKKFLEFIKNDKHFSRYYEGIYILFHTGMRISEFVGLTLSDINLRDRTITIDHQLQRNSQMVYKVINTKTTAGERTIPMTDDVYECFKKIVEMRKKVKVEPVIDGKLGFLYLDKNNKPMVALHWEKYFQHIREKYNRIYKEQIPIITPHVCRHTYCSNMAKSGMNPKTLQYLMGHSDISVTLNTYTHLKFEDARAEVKRITKLN